MCICTHIRRYHSKYFDKMFDNKLICNILISGWQGASSTYGTSPCIKTKLVKENKNQEINLSNNCKVLLLLFVRYLLLDMSYTRHTVISMFFVCFFSISFLRFILVFRQYDRLSRYYDHLLLHSFNQRFISCFWLITYIIVRG